MQVQPETRQTPTPDPTECCPNCGHRGVWQRCRLICENTDCGIRIVLACVD